MFDVGIGTYHNTDKTHNDIAYCHVTVLHLLLSVETLRTL